MNIMFWVISKQNYYVLKKHTWVTKHQLQAAKASDEAVLLTSLTWKVGEWRVDRRVFCIWCAALSLWGHSNQHDLSASHSPLGRRAEITDCMPGRQQRGVLKILGSELNKPEIWSWFWHFRAAWYRASCLTSLSLSFQLWIMGITIVVFSD